MKVIDKINQHIQDGKTFYSFEFFPPRTEEVRPLRCTGGLLLSKLWRRMLWRCVVIRPAPPHVGLAVPVVAFIMMCRYDCDL